MILNLRSKMQGTVAFVVVGIIAVPMALFGIDSLFLRGSSEPGVASVNKVAITEQRLQQAVAMQKQQLLARLGDIDSSLIDEAQLREPVLDRLIRQEALRQRIRGLGMSTAPQGVQAALREEPAFQTNGRFDRNRFDFLIRQMGYTPMSYLELIREELVSQQAYQALAYSEFSTQSELETLAGILTETRDISFITVPYAAVAADLEADESVLQDYYQQNTAAYVEPEQLVLEIVELRADALADELVLDEEEIELFFEQEQEELVDTSGWDVAHILLANVTADDPRVEAVQERLSQGEDFAELARELSEDVGSARQGGALGFGGERDFPPEFVIALAEMEPDSVSGPVETDSGVHFIKMLSLVTDDEQPSLEEERDRIVSELRTLRAREQMVALIDQLREQSYNAVSLRDVAEDLQLPYRLSEPFSRETAQGIVGHPRVVTAAYSDEVYEDGFASDLIEVADGHVMVVKVEEKIAARQIAFDEARARVEAEWRASEAMERVSDIGNRVLAAIAKGGDPQSVDEALNWQSLEGVERGDPRIATELSAFAFSVQASQSDPQGRLLPSGDYAVLKLELVEPGNLNGLASAERESLEAQLINDRTNRTIAAVEADAVAKAKVKR